MNTFRYCFPILVGSVTAFTASTALAGRTLKTCNRTSTDIYIALVKDNGGFNYSAGWWRITPNGCETFYDVIDAHARSSNGTKKWGFYSNGSFCVSPTSAFNYNFDPYSSCEGINGEVEWVHGIRLGPGSTVVEWNVENRTEGYR